MPIISGDDSNGGTFYKAVAAGAGTVTLVAPATSALGDFGGRICKVSITNTTASTAAVTFYDNATAASGTVLYVIPSGAVATGSSLEVQIPFVNGVTISAPAGCASFIVTFAN